MSDDIDIEEHDVLDNPRIRHIFPDIASIKTEVEDYDDQDTSIDIEGDHTYHNSGRFYFEEEIDIKPFNNKIIIGSKPCMSTSPIQDTVYQSTNVQGTGLQGTSLQGTELQGTSLQGTELQGTSFQGTELLGTGSEEPVFEGTSDRDTVLQETVTSGTSLLLQERRFQNRIILGSKTHSSSNSEESNSGDEEFELPDAYVLLEDCKTFLDNNPCFCRECEILFATNNDLDAHKMIAHSFLVAVSKNKAVKSTSKSHTNNDRNCKSLLCNHCNVLFPNTIALLRHTYELLPGKFACDECDSIFENDAACKSHKATHHTDDSDLTGPLESYAICKICSCHFKWTAKLRTHMKNFHHTTDIGDVQHVLSNLQCHFCGSIMNSSKHYNVHIMTYHPKLYHQIEYKKISKHQCPQCTMCFSSDYSVRIHLAAKHGYLGSVEDSKKLANTHKTPVESIKLPNPSKLPAKSQKNDTQNITKTRPLPKSTLFKCNKCQIHFVSCISAVLHSRSCIPTSKKGNYKCHQCRRTFKLQDKFYHDYQHSITEKFKVIEISRNILNRIICKCKTCGVCFDEKSFMTLHTDSCYSETPSIQCKECNIWIHARAMLVHKKIHANGLTFRDFIITEYVHASMPVKEHEKTTLIDKHKRKTTKIIKRQGIKYQFKRSDKKAFYYCPTCKCYMRINKHTDKHFIGQCNTKISLLTCKSCGLRFTKKSFDNHKSLHTMFPKLKLKDLKFINIQKGTRIVPPFPNFKKCKKCKVAFFSSGALINHACNSEESKICKYCHGKFSDLAYKLHVPYHEYAEKVNIHEEDTNDDTSEMDENIPDLLKKYESLQQVWNILYLCQSCDIVIDTYDKVVEHCQDHFCNMQSYNVTIEHCSICDLKFVDDCFKKHEKLHLNDDMNKESFTILKYKYENLLSESWMDMFRSLTKEQIQLILSKSMYKFTRSVRMRVVSKGSLDLTFYQCRACRAIVAPNRVSEHSQNFNGSCEGIRVYVCSYCALKFVYKSHKVVHENLHKVRELDAKSFRIIQFHADKNFSVTEVKNELEDTEGGKNKDPEGLKFIRCQHCGKLINKHKYKNHIRYHDYYNAKSKIKPVKQNTQQKTKQTSNKKVFNFYVCRECKVTVAKESIKVHICDMNGSKRKCTKCSLLFRSQNLASHYKSHEKNKISRSNMQVMYFDGEVIHKKPVRRLKLFETKKLDGEAKDKKPIRKLRFFETQKYSKKVMALYQCAQCNLCIWKKCNLSKHTCSPHNYSFTCELCGYAFHTSRRALHDEMHAHRSFDSTNIQVIKFNHKNPTKLKSKIPVSHKPKASTNYELIDKRKVEKRKLVAGYEGTLAKKPKIDNLKSTVDTVANFTNRYYKCKTCKLLFMTLAGLVKHEESCDTDRDAIKCKNCGLVFHAFTMIRHKNLVDCKIFIKERFYISTIKQLGKTNTANDWIYKCIKCDVFNISRAGLEYHFKTNHQSKRTVKTCEKCNIMFTSYSYNFHLKIHHGDNETDISELSIAEVDDTTIAEALQDLPNDEDVVYVDYNSLRCPKRKIYESIYTCDDCGLSFVNPRSLSRHKSRGRHNEEHIKCELCDFSFTHISLIRHMKIHHKNDEMKDGDETSNTDVNDTGSISSVFDQKQSSTPLDNGEEEIDMEEFSVDLPDDKNDGLDSNSGTSTNNAVNSSSTENMTGIYSCNVCDLNFVHPNSLQRHQKADKHNEKQNSCEICGLKFSFISLKKHMQIHHTNNRNKKKMPYSGTKCFGNDSVVESISRIFDIKPPDTSSQDKTKITKNINPILNTNNGNNSKISNSNNSLNETVNKNVNTNPTIEKDNNTVGHSRNNENSFNIIPNNNVIASRSIINNSNTTNENNTVLNKNKLFKCSLCNVHFLTAEDCDDHTKNHIQLDTFEYIACKICNLQFCCEFLGRHMKSHREKTFSTEDLIVAEYHPNNNGEVKIDTYLFVDRLKTKQVSTTIDDTEVDSTTENLVDSQSSSSVNDTSESIPCIEADVSSEA